MTGGSVARARREARTQPRVYENKKSFIAHFYVPQRSGESEPGPLKERRERGKEDITFLTFKRNTSLTYKGSGGGGGNLSPQNLWQSF